MARNADPKAPIGRTVIRDFLGYTPNMDPHDLQPGVAVTQMNAVSWKPGELRVRPGYVPVQFDT
jgi:hypothetical protein